MRNFWAMMFCMFLASCASTQQKLDIFRAYDGPVKAVEQVASVHVPSDMELVAINDLKVSAPLLAAPERVYHIMPGTVKLSFRYERLWELGNDEHDVIESPVYYVATQLEAGERYRLSHQEIEQYSDAIKVKEQLSAWLVDSSSNKIVAQLDSYKNQESSLVDKFFGNDDAPVVQKSVVQKPVAQKPVVQQKTVAVKPVSPPAPKDLEKDVVADAQLTQESYTLVEKKSSVVEQLQALWNKASTEERQAFHKWLYSK